MTTITETTAIAAVVLTTIIYRDKVFGFFKDIYSYIKDIITNVYNKIKLFYRKYITRKRYKQDVIAKQFIVFLRDIDSTMGWVMGENNKVFLDYAFSDSKNFSFHSPDIKGASIVNTYYVNPLNKNQIRISLILNLQIIKNNILNFKHINDTDIKEINRLYDYVVNHGAEDPDVS